MPNWQLTATTLLCDDCGEVTVIVYKDGRVKCTGAGSDREKSAKTGCSRSSNTCERVAAYKAKLEAEDAGA